MGLAPRLPGDHRQPASSLVSKHWQSSYWYQVCLLATAARCCRSDLPNAGLANITATTINLLGYAAPSFYEASLLATN